MEVTFQNKREDFEAFYDYMLEETQGGKQLGKQLFRSQQLWSVLTLALLCTLVWGILGNVGFSLKISLLISVIFFICVFVIGTGLRLLIAGFKPHYYFGREFYRKQEKLLTEKDLQSFQFSRTLTIDDDWLEIRCLEALHRWRWRRVDQIGITSNFVFIHVGACPVIYVPKRDFPSEQNFIEFGKVLLELKEKNKEQSLGAI